MKNGNREVRLWNACWIVCAAAAICNGFSGGCNLYAQDSAKAAATKAATAESAPIQHPALFLVGDSIMKTGTGDGSRGPWGWGAELAAFFDPAKIHVYNEGRGGRSSRGYIEEGAWAKVRDELQPGDFVIVQFGHNDAANSANYPDRISAKGNGDETQEIDSPVTHQKETIHSYGWYLRQYAAEAKAKGATIIVCSPVPRNQWADGKIKRDFDGYAGWAAEAAKQSGTMFIDLNSIAADRYDALGKEKAASYFNDTQHTTKAGAKINAESVVAGLKQLKECKLIDDLLPGAPDASKPAAATATESTPSIPASNNQSAAAEKPPAKPAAEQASGKPSLYVLGDSTAANNPRSGGTIQGWGTPFLEFFDPAKINVVNAARGGRSARTYITEGALDNVVAKLKPGDIVLVQFGHNDAYDINDTTGRGSLHGIGEESEELDNKITHKHEVVHTFGWYMRKYIADIRAKGAEPIVLTLTIRDRWNKDGTIERLPLPNIDMANTNRFHEPPIYSVWSTEVAKAEHVPLLDVHNLIADRYEHDGKSVVDTYFNNPGDPTHRNAKGAQVDAELTLAALRILKGQAFDEVLSEKGRNIAPADPKYVLRNAALGE